MVVQFPCLRNQQGGYTGDDMGHSEPGGREPAPSGLRAVQAFINTNDIEEGRDELGSPAALGTWLRAHGLATTDWTPAQGDLEEAIRVREALRSLAGANGGEPARSGAIEILNRAATGSPLVVHFDHAGATHLQPVRAELAGALGRLLADVHRATVDGTWFRLKTCRNDVCRWAFYDHSRNHSGRWCTMADCGERLKARAYRRRRLTGSTADRTPPQ
jgi:predicted RNA-binding Zn ribbon-like protein